MTVVTFTDLGDSRTEMVFRTMIRTTAYGLETAAAGFASSFDRLADHLGRRGRHARPPWQRHGTYRSRSPAFCRTAGDRDGKDDS